MVIHLKFNSLQDLDYTVRRYITSLLNLFLVCRFTRGSLISKSLLYKQNGHYYVGKKNRSLEPSTNETMYCDLNLLLLLTIFTQKNSTRKSPLYVSTQKTHSIVLDPDTLRVSPLVRRIRDEIECFPQCVRFTVGFTDHEIHQVTINVSSLSSYTVRHKNNKMYKRTVYRKFSYTFVLLMNSIFINRCRCGVIVKPPYLYILYPMYWNQSQI